MVRRSSVMAAVAILVTLGAVVWQPFSRDSYAQEPPTGYDQLLLCQMPGATKAEGQSATGLTSLFAGTFTVRTRNWRWLADASMWHGEWWLRDASGGWSWVPVGTTMPCSYYPSDLSEGWIVGRSGAAAGQ